jgi:phosphate acyltransferase
MIAVDAMGGDYAPKEIVVGSVRAARRKIDICLFGPEKLIKQELTVCDPLWKEYPIHVCHSSEYITMDEDSVIAVKKKPDSSLVQAVKHVKKGLCSSLVSAGNSGSIMAAATLFLKRFPGVSRPAIAGFLPTLKGKILALDLGANTECRAEHLHQFALMGYRFAQNNLNIKNPKIGLLSNGHENSKGSKLTKEVFCLLNNDPAIHFFGNIEPYDVFAHKTDVVVCDGFSGNILLKTVESVYKLIINWVQKSAYDEGLQNWSNRFIADVAEKAVYINQGGAFLLGIEPNIIVCHGNANAYTIEKAILLVNNHLNGSTINLNY